MQVIKSIVKKLISFMEAAVVTEEAVEILEPAVILVLVLIPGIDFVVKKKMDLSVVFNVLQIKVVAHSLCFMID